MLKKVLVTGATGKQGGAVARVLVERGHEVRAITRDPDKPEAEQLRGLGVEVVKADYGDPATVREAMRGVDAAFLMATPYEEGPDAETKEAVDAIDVAKQAGVEHLVYSSVANADRRTGIPHFESKRKAEEHLERSGLRYTIVAPVFFMENFVGPWMLPGLVQGKVTMPLAPAQKLQIISLQDIARFTAEVIERPDSFVGKRIDIASDELPVYEMAEILSRAAGRKIEYEELPKAKARETLGEDSTLMYEWFERVGYSADIAKLRREHPDVGWQKFDTWATSLDWTFLTPAAAVHAEP